MGKTEKNQSDPPDKMKLGNTLLFLKFTVEILMHG